MFGWEFPPYISGGLGTACEGIVSGLIQNNVAVTMVLPKASNGSGTEKFKILDAGSVGVSASVAKQIGRKLKESAVFIGIDNPIMPYVSPAEFGKNISKGKDKIPLEAPEKIEKLYFRFTGKYGRSLLTEVHNYAIVSNEIARNQTFDIIHAHDWLTFPAAMEAKIQSGKPLVTHIHATEFDRSGDDVDTRIYQLEKQAMEMADLVIAVSGYTKQILVKRYNIPSSKITVIHNAITWNKTGNLLPQPRYFKEKIITYMGRITYQKGPEYFIKAAAKILQKGKNFRFIMAGNGNLYPKMVELVAKLSISDRFHFTGFLKGDEVTRLLSMSDVFVMPSVSEPFGIVPLEAIQNRIPTIISKQSGVQETLSFVIKVDFWDIDLMANAIYGIGSYPSLARTLAKEGWNEIKNLNWNDQAKKIKNHYQLLSA